MADDDDERAREWAQAQAQADETVADGVPELIEAATPGPELTGNHRLTPAVFMDAVALADADGYRRGEAAGYRRGVEEGRAEVKATDWAAGVEDALAGVRVYLMSEGIVHVEEFTKKCLPFIKRTG